MQLSPEEIQQIVRKVIERINRGEAAPAAAAPAPRAAASASPAPVQATPEPSLPVGATPGIYPDIDSAVRAAAAAQAKLMTMGVEKRRLLIENMRRRFREAIPGIAERTVRETGLGRVQDKIGKNTLAVEKTPGVEDLEPIAWTGDDGLTLVERSPFGVIGSITPTTNPTETIVCNSIGMIAAGNAVTFNTHPRAKRVCQEAIGLLNNAIVEAGGPPNLLTGIAEPSLKSSDELMHHPGIRLLIVTGGGEVAKAAFQSGKKAIVAGPGNPPAVVDETADLALAARNITNSASLDNNILCTAEKEMIVVASVADRFIDELKRASAYHVIGSNVQKLENLIFKEPGHLNRDLVGLDVQVILSKIGITVPANVKMAFVETGPDHPFVHTEMLMPVLPVVRVADVHAAIDLAIRAEKGNRHTATMHSRDITNLHKMARECEASIFVKNGPSYAGLGMGGEGYTSFSIAGPTGEGLTRTRNFCRERRCTLKDLFNIVGRG
ncbi:MAG: aldehyde dehydrogenase EutE [Candidatus Wallbacteria bacterium]|nr:aldehyde dehydrogenase EutE [Candidatus Wallbacteria bacterium]